MLLLYYPRCSTCRKALKWLKENSIKIEERDIVLENPTAKEIKAWHKRTNLDLKKFFNTSGIKYRELNLKDKLVKMSDAEKYKLLASDGMLVKRPLLVGEDFVLTGFKLAEWENVVLS